MKRAIMLPSGGLVIKGAVRRQGCQERYGTYHRFSVRKRIINFIGASGASGEQCRCQRDYVLPNHRSCNSGRGPVSRPASGGTLHQRIAVCRIPDEDNVQRPSAGRAAINACHVPAVEARTSAPAGRNAHASLQIIACLCLPRHVGAAPVRG